MKPRMHFFGGQGIGWALDEDLDRARLAVEGRVTLGSFARSRIIHSAWWPPLVAAGKRALEGKSVLCFADNPPAFYLTCHGFEEAAARVDLWIARSQEAVGQFRELGLPVAYAPYSVDQDIFCPIPEAERRSLREKHGIRAEDFLVGNFHRDSLERDISLPKAQKGPDIFADVVELARREIPYLKVLLAGPRRHWLRRELARRGIPYVFVGKEIDGDDFRVNVLPRSELNRLYAMLDGVLISSRWEGGPYAVLEALFAGRPVISTSVGMAADLLPGYLYATPGEGAGLLVRIAVSPPDIEPLRQAALESHSMESLGDHLMQAYGGFDGSPEPMARAIGGFVGLGLSRLRRIFRQPLGAHSQVARAMAGLRRNGTPATDVEREAARIVNSAKATR